MNVVYMHIYIHYYSFKLGQIKDGLKELYFEMEGE